MTTWGEQRAEEAVRRALARSSASGPRYDPMLRGVAATLATEAAESLGHPTRRLWPGTVMGTAEICAARVGRYVATDGRTLCVAVTVSVRVVGNDDSEDE